MGTSEITKKLKIKRNIFCTLDYVIWIGVAIFTIVSTFCMLEAKDSGGMPILSEEVKALLVSLTCTSAVGIIAAIIIKDKIRTAVWMISLLICSLLYKEVGMYCILGAWFTDEYLIHSIFNYYKGRVKINKEIDLRM